MYIICGIAAMMSITVSNWKIKLFFPFKSLGFINILHLCFKIETDKNYLNQNILEFTFHSLILQKKKKWNNKICWKLPWISLTKIIILLFSVSVERRYYSSRDSAKLFTILYLFNFKQYHLQYIIVLFLSKAILLLNDFTFQSFIFVIIYSF